MVLFLHEVKLTIPYGLTVDVKEDSRLEREERAYVDYDEIDSLIKGIDYISKIDIGQTKLKNFEAHYRTKGELDVITFNGSRGMTAAVAVGRISAVRAYLTQEKLKEFRQLVLDAKTTIDQIRQ